MNELLNDALALQRYSDDIARAEHAYAQRAAFGVETQSSRDRIALGLVTMATKLQPSLTIQIQRPAHSSTS